MTVPVQNPYNSYNANGSTTQFRYEFLIKDASDLSVTLDGAVVDKSKYTLTNVGQSNGGDVTFSTAPVAGLLIIRRAVIAQRLTDYQDNGPLRAEDVNRDFDRVVMMIQDKQADADTALKHPLGQNGTSAPYTYDANGGRIIDLGTPTADTDAATKKYVDDLYIDKAAQAVRQAEAARDAAAVSANAAAASQQSASSSQSAASGSQIAAKTSETNAANSASAAATSASAAAGSASTASTAAGTATGAATTATQAASGATQQANQASGSATAAGQSATAAAGSATTAGQQAGAAAGSAAAAFNAQKAAEKARDEAINVAPGNYVLKTNNLSDLADKSTARANLNVQGAKCVTSTAAGDFNALSSPDDKLNLLIANNGTWGVQSTAGVITPLLVERGGTGATDIDSARYNLQVDPVRTSRGTTSGEYNAFTCPNKSYELRIANDGSWRVANNATNATSPLAVENGGTGAKDTADARATLGITALGLGSDYPLPSTGAKQATGFYSIEGGSNQVPPQAVGTGCGLVHISGLTYGLDIAGVMGGGARLFARTYAGDVGQTWREFWSDGNTTTDANGNLKPSSPIVKLKGDGTAELNEEAEGVMVERIDTGVYKVSGVLGFNSDPVWGGAAGGYVIPQNGNGLPLLWVDYDVAEDGDLTIKTYHREHLNAPEYARNHIEGVSDGDPVDIPAGRWIDLRVEMPDDRKQ